MSNMRDKYYIETGKQYCRFIESGGRTFTVFDEDYVEWLEKHFEIQRPYMLETLTIQKKKYNASYGDGRICKCGHKYYRHFDTYEHMEPIGCKYCQCSEFVEAKKVFYNVDEKKELLGHIVNDNEFMIAEGLNIETLSIRTQEFIIKNFKISQESFLYLNPEQRGKIESEAYKKFQSHFKKNQDER